MIYVFQKRSRRIITEHQYRNKVIEQEFPPVIEFEDNYGYCSENDHFRDTHNGETTVISRMGDTLGYARLSTADQDLNRRHVGR